MSVALSDIERFLRDHRPEPLPEEGLRQAAVLFALTANEKIPEILLTQRTDLVEHHKGQVSFPGGMKDPDDSSIEATALREAREEVGLDPADVDLLGRTRELITPTGFIITPIIGRLRRKPPLTLNRDEVEHAFYVPVSLFFDPSAERTSTRDWRGETQTVYSYEFNGYQIWGVTAFIIRTFLKDVAESIRS